MEYKKLNQPAAMGRKRIAVASAGDARAESRRTRSALGGSLEGENRRMVPPWTFAI